MDAFAFIDFNNVKKQLDSDCVTKIVPEIKSIESEVWKTYLENDYTL